MNKTMGARENANKRGRVTSRYLISKWDSAKDFMMTIKRFVRALFLFRFKLNECAII